MGGEVGKGARGASRRGRTTDPGENGGKPNKPSALTDELSDPTGPADDREIQGQFARSKADRANDGTVSAEPRVLSGDEDGDATFPLKQGAQPHEVDRTKRSRSA
jgi:hypothetical protein